MPIRRAKRNHEYSRRYRGDVCARYPDWRRGREVVSWIDRVAIEGIPDPRNKRGRVDRPLESLPDTPGGRIPTEAPEIFTFDAARPSHATGDLFRARTSRGSDETRGAEFRLVGQGLQIVSIVELPASRSRTFSIPSRDWSSQGRKEREFFVERARRIAAPSIIARGPFYQKIPLFPANHREDPLDTPFPGEHPSNCEPFPVERFKKRSARYTGQGRPGVQIYRTRPIMWTKSLHVDRMNQAGEAGC